MNRRSKCFHQLSATRKVLLLAVILLMSMTSAAQRQRREYTPSPVKGAAWNAPGNINPILPGYFADPTIRRFGDIYYIYATTDGTGNGYGPAQVWASYDFVNWQNMVMNWPTTEVVWAPDVVQQPDGTFRYYYCEPCVISIGESASPVGPWKNILGSDDAAMVPDRYVHNAITLDPQLFTDDDGAQYLYFTTWGIYDGFGCGVAKLATPAPSFQNAGNTEGRQQRADARRWREDHPFPIPADQFFSEKRLIPNTQLKDIFEAPFVFKRGDIYYFTYSSGSCHTDTYRVQYAISTTGPMGPFEYKGELLTTNENQTVHGPGHHSVLERDGRYFIVYHRHNLPRSVHGFNRQVCIDELQFDDQGNILPVVPTHDAVPTQALRTVNSKQKNLAFGAKATASSYYDEWFKPDYAVDDNNATLWKAARANWDGGSRHDEWLQIDLGKVQRFNEVWTQFEYATFFYQYKIETSVDGRQWTLYADRTANTMQGSPMRDSGKAKARYLRITIADTQKNGHMPAIWNVKVWQQAPRLPLDQYDSQSSSSGQYPGMHQKDVEASQRSSVPIVLDVATLAQGHRQPFDVEDISTTTMQFKASKPIRARVKDGRWALFFNGTQHLDSDIPLPEDYCYNAPYTITAWVLSTKVGPVSTVASLSASGADLTTTEFRLGTDPGAGLVNHNGSYESYGAPRDIKDGEGRWQLWVVTFDGWMERAYCNGRLVHEQNNFLMIRTQQHITVGASATGANAFMGYISRITVEPRSMTASEVTALYDAQRQATLPSLGDDDFEEIDSDSKFELSPAMKLVFEKRDEFTLSAKTADFNDAPLENGAYIYKEVEGDFVAMIRVSDMEGLQQRRVTSYNEGGIIIADEHDNYYQLGAFPLYNCGNMLTHLSPYGRPQFPNYKSYDFDPIMQFERRGDRLYARTSRDGKTWENMPGSPILIKGERLSVGAYQTTYTDRPSWVKLSDFVIYQ